MCTPSVRSAAAARIHTCTTLHHTPSYTCLYSLTHPFLVSRQCTLNPVRSLTLSCTCACAHPSRTLTFTLTFTRFPIFTLACMPQSCTLTHSYATLTLSFKHTCIHTHRLPACELGIWCLASGSYLEGRTHFHLIRAPLRGHWTKHSVYSPSCIPQQT